MRNAPGQGKSVTAGIVTIVLIALVSYFGFTKSNPFAEHFEIKAAFKTSNDLKAKSPVRIAGVKIGLVDKVEALPDGGSLVTMRIDDRSIPIRRDARMKVRPRIFLEGNYFVDVSPGSPSAPPLAEGGVIPVQQTAAPVQFGQVLAALQSDTRRDLQIVLQEYGKGLSGKGGEGYNRSIQYWEPAFKNSAIVNEASLGIAEHDLSGYIEGAGAVAAAFDRDPEALKSLVTDFAETAEALAVEGDNLSRAIAELPSTLIVGRRALLSLNRAFPPFRRFIAAMRPAVRSSRPALDATLPFLIQARGLVSGPELRGLVADLRPTVPSLVELNEGGVAFQQQVRLLSSCQNTVVLPWQDTTIQDEAHPPSGPIYQEGVKWLPGIAGESRSFDANGQYVKTYAAAANYAYALGDTRNFLTGIPLQGVNPPRKADGRPPLRGDVPCETQEGPDMRSNPSQPPPVIAVNQTSPAARALNDKSKLAASRWLAKQMKTLGIRGRVAGLAEAERKAARSDSTAGAKAAGAKAPPGGTATKPAPEGSGR